MVLYFLISNLHVPRARNKCKWYKSKSAPWQLGAFSQICQSTLNMEAGPVMSLPNSSLPCPHPYPSLWCHHHEASAMVQNGACITTTDGSQHILYPRVNNNVTWAMGNTICLSRGQTCGRLHCSILHLRSSAQLVFSWVLRLPDKINNVCSLLQYGINLSIAAVICSSPVPTILAESLTKSVNAPSRSVDDESVPATVLRGVQRWIVHGLVLHFGHLCCSIFKQISTYKYVSLYFHISTDWCWCSIFIAFIKVYNSFIVLLWNPFSCRILWLEPS